MISIVTPVYNGCGYIEACIQSVIAQNCPEVEHIIIDGGSTDGTVQIIREYAARYPHIRWITEKDRGQSDAMNKGIAMAKGEILGFLNVDDYYEPGVLNRVACIFHGLLEPALLVGNCHIWNDDGQLIDINKPRKLKLEELLLGPYVNPFPINPSAYFCHLSLVLNTGYYDVDDHYVMDLDFILRAVQIAHVVYVDETWGNFRLIKGAKTKVDAEMGTADRRIESILVEYRKDLSRLQRWRLVIQYPIYNYRPLFSLTYFWRNPQELPWRLKARLRKIYRSGLVLR